MINPYVSGLASTINYNICQNLDLNVCYNIYFMVLNQLIRICLTTFKFYLESVEC